MADLKTLDEIINKAASFRPEDRFSDVNALKNCLEKLDSDEHDLQLIELSSEAAFGIKDPYKAKLAAAFDGTGDVFERTAAVNHLLSSIDNGQLPSNYTFFDIIKLIDAYKQFRNSGAYNLEHAVLSTIRELSNVYPQTIYPMPEVVLLINEFKSKEDLAIEPFISEGVVEISAAVCDIIRSVSNSEYNMRDAIKLTSAFNNFNLPAYDTAYAVNTTIELLSKRWRKEYGVIDAVSLINKQYQLNPGNELCKICAIITAEITGVQQCRTRPKVP